jgi:hypothetical protein
MNYFSGGEMSGKRLLMAVLAGITLLSAAAVAQDEKNELSGILGRTFNSDQGTIGSVRPVRFGQGLSFEVNYARHLRTENVYGISLEVPAMIDIDQDLNASGPIVPIDYKVFFVTPSARVTLFPTTAVTPWVSFGGGFGHFSQNNNLIYGGGPNPGKSTNTGVIQGGIGLDVKFLSRFSIRGEVRDFWSGHPDFPLANTGKSRQHNFFVGGGVVWHF